MPTRRAALAGALALPWAARAQTRPLRLGVLTTLSGPAADGAGTKSVLARAWFDREGVQAVLDMPNSATALAVAGIARACNGIALFSGAGTMALTTPACGPNHLQWTCDTAVLATGAARAVLAEGGRTWFFLTADYVFGHALQADVTAVVGPGAARWWAPPRFRER